MCFGCLSLFFFRYDVHFGIVLHFIFLVNTSLNMRFHTSIELQCHFDATWLDLVNPQVALVLLYISNTFPKNNSMSSKSEMFSKIRMRHFLRGSKVSKVTSWSLIGIERRTHLKFSLYRFILSISSSLPIFVTSF